MSPEQREQLERQVRQLCQEGRHTQAAETAIRGYGPEIFGLLAATHRDEHVADEVFALWSERLWRGLAAFAWECSLRTWAYAIAHNASRNHLRDARLRAERSPALDESEAARVAQQVRTETKPYLRTEARRKLDALRDSLPDEDRTLLVLRLDKGLEWKDLARVMHEGEEPASEEWLTRESQRLRKRFQLLKEKLVERGRREGMFEE